MTTIITRNRILIPVLTLVAGLLIGLALRGPGGSTPAPGPSSTETATVWTCSMHPQIRLPAPGQCPICGMDLIPVSGGGKSSGGAATLTLSKNARRMAEVATAPVERREVMVTVRTVGKLEADETRVREISAWAPGRIDRLYVDYTGVPIRAGEPLFDLYSPQIYAGQEELIQSIRFVGDLARSSLESTRSSGTRTVDAAREKLRLLGLSATQIAAVEERGEASEHVTIQAPVSGVVLHKTAIQGGYVETGTRVYTIADLSVLWLQLDVYESDLEWVHLGQVVVFETDTNPGETFQGKVSFIDPVLTEATRSVKVRVEVQNPDGLLKPGMFARARMEADVPGESGGPPLVVPASAPLVTGARAIVYVADPDDPSTYHGREIVLGPRAGKWWVVRDGLREGESVVVRGNFKIDSELQIRAGRSMMNPAGGGPGPVPGHDHGVKQSAPIPPAPAEVSPEVRRAVDALLGEYYAVSGALSGDDHQAAVTAARALDRRARDAATLVSPDASWNTAVQALAGQAEALASAPDLETARVPLEPLSNGMIGMVRRFGTGSPSPVYVIHCPMAHGHGADWLQPHTKTVNPYYGSSMLGCGAVAETLWAAPASREKE